MPVSMHRATGGSDPRPVVIHPGQVSALLLISALLVEAGQKCCGRIFLPCNRHLLRLSRPGRGAGATGPSRRIN